MIEKKWKNAALRAYERIVTEYKFLFEFVRKSADVILASLIIGAVLGAIYYFVALIERNKGSVTSLKMIIFCIFFLIFIRLYFYGFNFVFNTFRNAISFLHTNTLDNRYIHITTIIGFVKYITKEQYVNKISKFGHKLISAVGYIIIPVCLVICKVAGIEIETIDINHLLDLNIKILIEVFLSCLLLIAMILYMFEMYAYILFLIVMLPIIAGTILAGALYLTAIMLVWCVFLFPAILLYKIGNITGQKSLFKIGKYIVLLISIAVEILCRFKQ